jgi:hypothetical protein
MLPPEARMAKFRHLMFGIFLLAGSTLRAAEPDHSGNVQTAPGVSIYYER